MISPREALIACLRAVHNQWSSSFKRATTSTDLLWDDELLALVPEEARRVLERGATQDSILMDHAYRSGYAEGRRTAFEEARRQLIDLIGGHDLASLPSLVLLGQWLDRALAAREGGDASAAHRTNDGVSVIGAGSQAPAGGSGTEPAHGDAPDRGANRVTGHPGEPAHDVAPKKDAGDDDAL